MKFRIVTTMLAILACTSVHAQPILDWSVSGPQFPVTSRTGTETTFAYSPTSPLGGAFYEATSAVVTEAGDYTFNWNYSGFHGARLANAGIETSDGTTLFGGDVFGFFSFSGTYTFADVLAGQTIGFSFGGGHLLEDPFEGIVVINQVIPTLPVPAPGVFVLFGLGLVLLGLRRSR